MKNRHVYFVFIAITLFFCVIVAGISIKKQGPHYKGHSLAVWLSSTNNREKAEIFREFGPKSFPFLMARLNGGIPDRERACKVIGDAFEKAQVQNTGIETKLRHILVTGD